MKKTILTCDICNKDVVLLYNNKDIYRSTNNPVKIEDSDISYFGHFDIRFEPALNDKDICEKCILKIIKTELFPDIIVVKEFPVTFNELLTETPKVEASDSGSSNQ